MPYLIKISQSNKQTLWILALKGTSFNLIQIIYMPSTSGVITMGNKRPRKQKRFGLAQVSLGFCVYVRSSVLLGLSFSCITTVLETSAGRILVHLVLTLWVKKHKNEGQHSRLGSIRSFCLPDLRSKMKLICGHNTDIRAPKMHLLTFFLVAVFFFL